ncbi:Glutamine--tRNA ligase [Nymphon striatum]|nr:Glutamine--tRNA ligase [Nymphon striatum]
MVVFSDFISSCISHSLCTLEFAMHRELYDWFLNQVVDENKVRPKQREFARRNLSHTVVSKRKLARLVEDGVVDMRDHLNKVAPRVMGVLNPLKVVITNYPEGEEEWLDAENNPGDESAGSRKVPLSKEIYIEKEDFREEANKKLNNSCSVPGFHPSSAKKFTTASGKYPSSLYPFDSFQDNGNTGKPNFSPSRLLNFPFPTVYEKVLYQNVTKRRSPFYSFWGFVFLDCSWCGVFFMAEFDRKSDSVSCFYCDRAVLTFQIYFNSAASVLIGKHFPDVGDKLLNLLDLAEDSDESELLLASIEQRSENLNPIPFAKAITRITQIAKLKTLKSTGNATFPEGTKVSWYIEGRSTDNIRLITKDTRIYTDMSYQISTSNKNVVDYEKLEYQFDIIKDAYPRIKAKQVLDSLNLNTSYYIGEASDDYALENIRLVCYADANPDDKQTINISESKNNFKQFYYTFPSGLQLDAGKNYSYYFEATDNDGVHNGKTSKSQVFTSVILDANQLKNKELESQQSIIKNMDKTLEKFKEQKETLKEINQDQKEKKQLNFNDQNQIKDFLKKQEQQENMMKKFSKQAKKNDETNELLKERLERQEIEAKKNEKLLEELNKIADKIDKEELTKRLEEIAKKQQNKSVKEDQKEALEEINKHQGMEESSESSEKEKTEDNAKKKQKSAAQKMKEMSEQLQESSSGGGGGGSSITEDAEMLRQILDNLVTFSFKQENLYESLEQLDPNAPQFSSSIRQQQELRKLFEHVDDSLFALSLRRAELSEFVNEQITEVYYNTDKALEAIAESQIYQGVSYQKYVLTASNSLSDFLANTLDNMQQSMQSGQGEGEGESFQLPDIIKGQGELKEKMEGMGQSGQGKPKSGKGEPGQGKKGEW